MWDQCNGIIKSDKNIMDRRKYSLQDFKLLTVFGVGNYSKVALVRKQADGKIYALKVIKKEKNVKGVKRGHAYIERDILQKVSHPFIIPLHATFQDAKRLFFILDYCPGGELFGLIRRSGRLSEEICRFYAAQILLGLEYLHCKKIIYRDLKPENVLFDRHGYIRLIDFGLSRFSNSEPIGETSQLAGTAFYLPPEAFQTKASLGFEADWWSFGSLLFEMIMGFPPFYVQGGSVRAVFQKIRQEQPPLFLINSEPLRDFISLLLQKNPKKRLGYKGSEEVKKHPWMMGVQWEKILRKEDKAPFIPNLDSDEDIKFFEDEFSPTSLSPSDQEVTNTEQIYPSFSVSWKSSRSPPQQHNGTTNLEILISIDEIDQLLPISHTAE